MNEVERFQKLEESIDSLKSRKIRLEERFNAKREKLEALVNEITEKGYDPKNLATIKQEKEEELKRVLDEIEKSVEEVAEKLNAIEV